MAFRRQHMNLDALSPPALGPPAGLPCAVPIRAALSNVPLGARLGIPLGIRLGVPAGKADNGGMDRLMDDGRHIPVLRDEVLAALRPDEGGLYLDATFGAGGYTAAILAHPGTRVLALDRDPSAIRGGAPLAARYGGRLSLVEARFATMEAAASDLGLAEGRGFDGVAMDIGVSSMQLDEAERGFSFRRDGPLDMRMGASGRTAAELVNTLDADALAAVLYHYGEERLSRRIAKAVVMDRAAAPFRTTAPLAALIARVVGHKPGDIHPATRSFQALRIAVNDELGELVAALAAAERLLKPGGRLAVVTFHSGEDRIVKQFLQRRAGRGEASGRRLPGEPERCVPSFTLPKGQPVAPGEDEARLNPRARSAKLRIGVRTDAPALPLEASLSELASLPSQKPASRQARAGKPAGRHGRTKP